ncbi:MAG: CPBP family intramembrane glutamic endopeptidase [Sphingomonas sp.]
MNGLIVSVSVLDHLLAFLLLAIIPARALWRSRPNAVASEPKAIRYLTTIGMMAGLLSILAADWLLAGRTVKALGLGPPTTTPAQVGLGLVTMLLSVLRLVLRRKSAATRANVEAARKELMPETLKERRLFLLFILAAGFGWEILYRGYLLYYLQPHVGLWGAVAVAALAYGVAHGFKSPRQVSGSIAAALAFTIGYAATGSLWWLMLLHSGLPLLSMPANKTEKG